MASYQEIYQKLKTHLQRTGANEALQTIGSEADFVGHMTHSFTANHRRDQMQPADQQVHDVLLKYMIENQTASKDLKRDLPEIYAEKKAYIKQLREDAEKHARADATKKEAAQIKAKRKEAKKELERIRKERIKNEAREQGREATEQELATPKLHEGKPTNWARRRNPLIGLANYLSLGSRKERRGLDEDGNKDPRYDYKEKAKNDKSCTPITHYSKDGKIMLKGATFAPKNPKNPQKVALVFSGSGAPGAQFIDSIKDAYLAQGITVVQLDYRGFGDSSNFDPKTKEPVSNSPSERTMYEDGMEMYRYVNEVMGVKPENITLHGYSMGGAIASRVALEETKKLQNRNVMENKRNDPSKGIGGIVLHSPMRSMYHAGKTQMVGACGFLMWAFGGGYNTEEHMHALSKIDNKIPVHMVGGEPDQTAYDCDWLSPEASGIKQSLENKFTHCTYEAGIGDHEGKKTEIAYDRYGDPIKNEDGTAKTVEKSEPNVRTDDTKLADIVNKGRKLTNPEPQLDMENEYSNGGMGMGAM